ncbi:MAG: putative baseplate assembly protein [Anaerolineae bacterium]|nr:putative baseplate assembly protein [Anaerolineae bacterium]
MSTSQAPRFETLNDCECCEGLTSRTPARIHNRPGLNAIAYRVGDHGRFKASMLAALSRTDVRPALAQLRTRADDDFSIALLDAWATVADVLTFYQERIANEAYLRTATERLSLAQLAALVGYELQPGVAAAAYLAFTADDSATAATVAKGAQVQSIPIAGGLPQTFETVESIVARPEWNALKPRMTQPQTLHASTTSVTLDGIASQVKPGDRLLVVYDTGKTPVFKKVLSVHVDTKAKTTRLDLAAETGFPTWRRPTLSAGVFVASAVAFSGESIAEHVTGASWHEADLAAFTQVQGWSMVDLAQNVNTRAGETDGTDGPGVYAFRKRASLFGHNAPKWSTLPANQRFGEWITKKKSDGGKVDAWVPPIYPDSWATRTLGEEAGATRRVDLDNIYSEIVKGSWVVLESPTTHHIYQVQSTQERTRADFTLQAKITRLTLDSNTDFASFRLRTTTIHAQSEALPLAELPIPNLVQGNAVELAGFYPHLTQGQKVIVSGNRSDAAGVVAHEVVTLSDVLHIGGFTVLEFTTSLAHRYLRESVTLNANVALATHGASHQEVLGSGDGRQTYQQFTLKRSPLTYVTDTASGGVASTLALRVNNILWKEAADLARLGPRDHRFVTRLDDNGETTVTFGDGEHGARLPTGAENVTATYRSGSGSEGNVGAESLTLLTKRPSGIRSVTNPLAASGGAGAESRDQVRRNAPLTVLTLDRIVSLQDYEGFALAFPGIAKALAVQAWQGQTQAVFLTVAGANGQAIAPNSPTEKSLLLALGKAGDPQTPLRVAAYRPAWFQVEAKLKVHVDYIRAEVLAAVEQALRSHYSFDKRAFGQSVALSELIGVIQKVAGVVAVDVDYLYRTGSPRTWRQRLVADRPKTGSELRTVAAAELLILDPRPITWGVMP